jgi:thiol-disulfide isomerase/thioredoxin
LKRIAFALLAAAAIALAACSSRSLLHGGAVAHAQSASSSTFPAELASEDWPQRPPRLIGSPADWINTDGKALQLQKGRVYLIDFWEYTCVNCIRTLPYLKAWSERYGKDGLTIVGIHTPEFAFAHDRANVAQAVKKFGLTYPVLVDSDYKNWNAYHNSYWPRKYFINSNGYIVADHSGEGDYQQSETLIRKLLLQRDPSLRFPPLFQPVRDTDKPGAVAYPTTAETYAGERGLQQNQLGNVRSFSPEAQNFTDTGDHADGQIYLSGDWITEQESLRHARATDAPTDYLALRYHALDCNAVLKPEGGAPLRVGVTQDGGPVAASDRGADLKADSAGQTYVVVDSPRMYNLIHNARFGSHEIRLFPTTPDFGLYSFTFSSSASK